MDDEELLEILFPEYRTIRPDEAQECADHGRDAFKMPRPMLAAQYRTETRDPDARALRLSSRVDGFNGGRKQKIDAPIFKESDVSLRCDRIRDQILGTVELQGIHEQGRDHPIS